MTSNDLTKGVLAAGAKADVVAYVDESGDKGFSRRLTAERDHGIGLFCSLPFPVGRVDGMRARFAPGYARFVAAMPQGAKAHMTDAFASGNESWARVAREVRDEYFALIRELEVPVVYEARRLRVDREGHEAHRSWLDGVRAQRRSRIRVSDRPSDRRVEHSLMTGLSLKLDCLCEDIGVGRVDILFDETDMVDAYRGIVDRLRTQGAGREYTVKGFDPDAKRPVVARAAVSLSVPVEGFRLDAVHLGDVRVVGKGDPLILATDAVANALFDHLTTNLPPGSHLNRPESVAGWALRDRVYGVRADALEDFV